MHNIYVKMSNCIRSLSMKSIIHKNTQQKSRGLVLSSYEAPVKECRCALTASHS